MNNKPLYITTFNRKLYDATGKNMINSFVNTMTEGNMLICYEDNETGLRRELKKQLGQEAGVVKLSTGQNFYLFDITHDPTLRKWTEDNADIIPSEYGGRCETFGNLIKNKYGTNFNRQTARWFRKIITIIYATGKEVPQHELTVLLDCDTIFTQHLPYSIILSALGNNEVLIHLGEHKIRRDMGVEAGFLVFKQNSMFPRLVIDCYMSGDFKRFIRWDDGYVYKKILEENPNIKVIDVVQPHIEQVGGHVICHGPFRDYVQHLKGIHSRSGLVVKN